MEFWTALSIGLFGSLHCVGMCGPIAFALPLDRSTPFSIFKGNSIYNVGRFFTYFLLGIAFGLFGRGLYLVGFQQNLSIAVGIVMILSVLWPIFGLKKVVNPSFNLWLGKVKAAMGSRFGRHSNQNLFVIGALNGLLPCGLVYMGLIGSIAMGNAFDGGIFMLAFGLGTLPLMLSIGVYGNQLQKKVLRKFKKFVPVFIVLIGALFILRGMDLGIPYVSPDVSSHDQIENCVN